MFNAKDLNYSTGNRPLIQEIHLDFAPGLIHAVLGPNGAGKTTLLKTLTGIWPLTKGAVLWNGEELLKKPREEISKIVTFVPQNPHIPFDFTVEHFVEMGTYPHKKKPINKGSVTQALKAVGALDYQTHSINALSQGERQRIFIARALVTEASVLIFDEPTANLDVKYQKIIWRLLKSLADQNKTIILSTHDLNACQVYCDLVHVLHKGRCVATGPYSRVMTPILYQTIFEE
jgi:ABC-type cobalamin/Fe3+-siderophores transport system ATPase subunit